MDARMVGGRFVINSEIFIGKKLVSELKEARGAFFSPLSSTWSWPHRRRHEDAGKKEK